MLGKYFKVKSFEILWKKIVLKLLNDLKASELIFFHRISKLLNPKIFFKA